jgi:hypothetical protein
METETGVEPIDSLQALFDTWLVTPVQELTIPIVSVFPNPVNDYFQLQLDRLDNELYLKIYTVQGRLLHQQEINQLRTTIRTDFMTEKGLLIYQLSGAAGQVLHHGKLIMEK